MALTDGTKLDRLHYLYLREKAREEERANKRKCAMDKLAERRRHRQAEADRDAAESSQDEIERKKDNKMIRERDARARSRDQRKEQRRRRARNRALEEDVDCNTERKIGLEKEFNWDDEYHLDSMYDRENCREEKETRSGKVRNIHGLKVMPVKRGQGSGRASMQASQLGQVSGSESGRGDAAQGKARIDSVKQEKQEEKSLKQEKQEKEKSLKKRTRNQ